MISPKISFLGSCYLNNLQCRLFCFLLFGQLRLKEPNLNFEELVPLGRHIRIISQRIKRKLYNYLV